MRNEERGFSLAHRLHDDLGNWDVRGSLARRDYASLIGQSLCRTRWRKWKGNRLEKQRSDVSENSAKRLETLTSVDKRSQANWISRYSRVSGTILDSVRYFCLRERSLPKLILSTCIANRPDDDLSLSGVTFLVTRTILCYDRRKINGRSPLFFPFDDARRHARHLREWRLRLESGPSNCTA